ncbi:ABC transporter ATP-binding protein [Nocardia brasiliensis]|uniref:Putative peptide ABC transporter ATP-binding protein n=1 Tax=Nocardia brasiliensis (strain ATCC 700358 / HUJEG-1) TaxID=1133849 RepID=K0FCP2_NOCB7|nr:ATP-binding cassette domain-containing protein [Nocardia brasiliensis]AFU05321.1 putative peptide ABC transporter ATP-binding protein [Nocardia brasiliensis ATCC 700358]OCF87969.1 peptide ABC transporter ATP-binding protein [Nocardia brasiliensis]
MAERGRDAAVRNSVLDGGLGVEGDSGGAAESAGRSAVPSCPVLVEGLAVHGPNGQELFGPLDFRIATGSVAALTGPSGAGKTTLMRALLGDLPRGAERSGSVVVAGHDVFALNPAALQRFRRTHVAYVGQDPGSALNPLMRVHGLLHEVAPHATRDYLAETLELVGLSPEHLRRRAAELSGGQQRRVALARALIRHADVLILDEPLAGLHGALRTDIARLLTEVAADRSVAVLLSGHDTATIHAVADQVIELGSAVTTFGGPDRTAAAPLLFARSATPGRAEVLDAPDRAGSERTPLLLRGNGITAVIAGREVLTGVDVELAAGSALAVVGASGAGKTTLARVIAGLHRTATGTLELHGAVLPLAHGARKLLGSNGIQLVTQNPRSALNPRRTVAQTLARPLRRFGGVPRRQVAQHVTDLLAAVELAPELAQRYPHQLSGGQRQRVAVARALAAEPAVLLCDEITSALDHATAGALMALLDRIRAERAMGLLVISHDMALVAAHCPRIVVLDHGRIVESGETATILAAPAQQATRDLLR